MGRRNCASCRFYERSSIARMGWCRHPELYDPHHNHLVAADDLDCDRGTGDFWESVSPATVTLPMADVEAPGDMPVVSVTSTGSPVFAVSGSSGYGDDPPPPAPGGGGGPSWGNGDRGDFNYYEEERYWTDYLRIAAPVLGVIVLVVLLWLWIASFLGDDDGNGDIAEGTATTEIPTFAASPDATEGDSVTQSPPAAATTPAAGEATPTTPAGEPTEPGGGNGAPTEIYLGATVEVAGTDGAGLNVRSEPTTGAEVLTVFLDGTQVEVIDGPVQAEGFEWWQVSGNEVEAGWIVSDFVVVVE